jgi:hypothetical protein
MRAPAKKPTLQAVIARINRKLAHVGERLRKARGEQQRAEVGDYYGVNLARNRVIQTHVEPWALAVELGVVRHHELPAPKTESRRNR